MRVIPLRVPTTDGSTGSLTGTPAMGPTRQPSRKRQWRTRPSRWPPRPRRPRRPRWLPRPPLTTIGAEDEVVYESEQPQSTLTGGSIDDNERFEDYLAYRADFFGLGIAVRDLDPTGRIVVTVTGEGNLPAAGAEVVVAGEGIEVSLRTTADGTVRFHPEAYAAGAGPFTVSAGNASTMVERGHSVALKTSLPTATGQTVALDVLFLLDATGSMDDEIHQLKITIDEVAQRIHQLPRDVDVRLGMTLYRDEGDEFLTSTFDLTPDIEAFAEALSAVVADGGDDYPEALDEALADALSQPSWRSASETVQLVFLVADAPPQILRQVPVPYTDSMREAARRGIKIFPVSSSGPTIRPSSCSASSPSSPAPAMCSSPTAPEAAPPAPPATSTSATTRNCPSTTL